VLHRRLEREGEREVIAEMEMKSGGGRGGRERISPVDVVEDIEWVPPGI
jgi:hypothetical protein